MSDASLPPSGPSPDPEHYRNAKAEAKAARAYAKASRPWFQKKRWWAVGAVIAMFIAVAASSGGSGDEPPAASDSSTSAEDPAEEEPAEEEPADEPEEEPEEEPAEEKKPAVKTVKVAAGKIIKEFEENELAADTKYKGKHLRINGVVAKIDTELFDDDKYILEIGSGGDFEFWFVNCHDMSTDELGKLKVGQDVVVIGKFDDGGDLGVDLNDCKLA